MPAIYPFRVFPDRGGLISYGSNVLDLNQQAGIQESMSEKFSGVPSRPTYPSNRAQESSW
jgi:hypothetical protein